jgi:ESS family glutamate:Na+ symporter
MNFNWSFFIDLGIIGAGLLLATLIRARVRFFQKYLIPNALTAGFILLPLYNFVLPRLGVTASGLGALVYHLLSIAFISTTLRKSPPRRKKGDKRILATSVSILSQYAVQTLLGLFFTLLFMATIMPDLFPSFGLLLPLGFVLGPGQALAIGQGWEAFGFHGASTVGLTFAAVGFLWACFGGVFLINFGIRHGWLSPKRVQALAQQDVKTGLHRQGQSLPVGSHLTTESEAIDSVTFHAAFVFLTYVLTFLLLKLLTYLLSFAGNPGRDLAVNLWGISFVFALLVALGVKRVIGALKLEHVLDNGTLTRISGLSVDLMVTAAIAAISLVVVRQYWLPILILCVLAGCITLVTVPWFCSRIFKDHRFHRTLMIYGVSTGTMPTGLALLRVIDPYFETPVASDYMFATGLTFIFAIPFILAINLPAYSHTTGNPLYFWLTVAVGFAYLAAVLLAFFFLDKKRAFKNPSQIWLREEGEEDD